MVRRMVKAIWWKRVMMAEVEMVRWYSVELMGIWVLGVCYPSRQFRGFINSQVNILVQFSFYVKVN